MADYIKRKGKGGKVRWQARVRRKGYPDQFKTFATKREAETWATGVEDSMAKGTFVDFRDAARTTLGDALKVYRDEVTIAKAGHQEKYVINAWLHHDLAKRSLASLRPIDFQRWVTERSKVVGPKTIKLHIGVISHLFNKLEVICGIAGLSNPIAKVTLPRLPDGRDRRLRIEEREGGTDFDEAAALIAAFDKARNPWLKPAVLFALDSAMRRSEIVQLRWDHVDLRAGTVRLPPEITKTKKGREIALSPTGIELLRVLPRSIDGRVFPITAEALYRGFARTAKRAKLADLHFHDHRHEATSRLREDGLDLAEIRTITGHQTMAMLMRYMHVEPKTVVAKRRLAAGGGNGG